MDREVALKFINSALLNQKKRSLSKLEITILQGSWSGNTYEQISESSEYSFNYLMRDVGPKFWRLLTEIFGENVNKNNFPLVIEKLYRASKKPKPAKDRHLRRNAERQTASIVAERDWENSPARLSEFRGYHNELTTLKQEVMSRNTRLINLWGLTGVGKTALMRELASQIKNEFEFIIWRSLSETITFSKLAASLADGLKIEVNENSAKLSSLLLAKMRSHTCLILLDGVEAVLQPGQLAGTYRAGYEDYGKFFQAVGESFHQSCVITTSLESLGGIFQFTGENSPIRSHKLGGLSLDAARSLIASRQRQEHPDWQKPIDFYQGNPAMLSIAQKIIKELFNNRLEEFIAQKSWIFGDIDRMLKKSFNRLSLLEQEILYWLASQEHPPSLAEIQSKIPISIYPVELLETIKSLNQRALVESKESETGSSFGLTPMVSEFAIDQFIEQMRTSSLGKERPQRLAGSTKAIKLNNPVKKPIHLSNWLNNSFELEWQSLDALLSLSNKSLIRLRSAFDFRDRAMVKRFTEIELTKNPTQKVVLLVAVTKEQAGLEICAQVQPAIGERVLPKNLQICLVDAASNIAAEATSGTKDNFVQLPYFYGELGEKFAVRLNLQSVSYEAEFAI